MDDTWTIGELAERAAAALAADGAAQVSGRVRDLPNTRLIRWYTTIGLVDPPLGRRGRIALYGPRHLLQLVAVKRRQAEGRSIAEIQVELAAATDEALARIAALPADPSTTTGDAPLPAGSPPSSDDHPQTAAPAAGGPGPTARAGDSGSANPPGIPTGSPHQGRPTTRAHRREAPESTTAPRASKDGTPAEKANFWAVRPDVSYREAATVSADYGTPLPAVVQGVRLAPGLTLLLDGPALSDDDLAAIDAAARPLLAELRRRGLVTPAESPAHPPEANFRRSQ
ncbi:MerR family transcriptional regulator [Spirillospora sp. NPDC127506]|uniref:helix-turn-helix domain-containing protein n=1 Tax=Actinomadura sp. TaxID=1989 RepID=UPI003351E928